MQRLISIDPGETTGVIIAEWDEESRNIDIQEIYEVKWNKRFEIVNKIITLVPDRIIMEDFRLYANKAQAQIGNSFPSVKFISLVEYAAWMIQVPVVFQMASDVRNVAIPDDYIGSLRGSEHKKDAFKHLRRYVIKKLHGK